MPALELILQAAAFEDDPFLLDVWSKVESLSLRAVILHDGGRKNGLRNLNKSSVRAPNWEMAWLLTNAF